MLRPFVSLHQSGCHWPTSSDLTLHASDAFGKKLKGSPDHLPTWVLVLRPYCRYQTACGGLKKGAVAVSVGRHILLAVGTCVLEDYLPLYTVIHLSIAPVLCSATSAHPELQT